MGVTRKRSVTPRRGATSPPQRKAKKHNVSVPGSKIEREIRLPDGTFKTFEVSKGPLHGLAGPEIQKALSKMPNGGRVGGKPVSPGFKASAASAKAYGVPPKGVSVVTWKNLSHAKRAKKRKEEQKRRKKVRRSLSDEDKKLKQKRRRSSKAGAAKVKRVNSRRVLSGSGTHK